MSKLGSFVQATSSMSGIKGPRGGDLKALRSVDALGLGDQVIADAVKAHHDNVDDWTNFNALGNASRALPLLDDLVTRLSSFSGYNVEQHADEVGQRLVEALEDVKKLIEYGKAVAAVSTYIKMFQLALNHPPAQATDEDKDVALRALQLIGAPTK